jgi:ABC-type sulfate transport system substrate-binding protein
VSFSWKGLIVPVMMILTAGCASTPAPSPLASAEQAMATWRDTVYTVIGDRDRAGKVIGQLDQLEQLVRDADRERRAHDRALRALNANYDATEAEFESVFAAFNARRRARHQEALAINREIRSLTGAEEWKALSRVKADVLDAAIMVGRGS